MTAGGAGVDDQIPVLEFSGKGFQRGIHNGGFAIQFDGGCSIDTVESLLIVSQFLADNEQAFYGIIMFIGIAYTLIMALTGIMQVHNYTLGKTLLTLLLTLVAVFIIIFLVMLVANFIGQVVAFFQSIYTELIFRF